MKGAHSPVGNIDSLLPVALEAAVGKKHGDSYSLKGVVGAVKWSDQLLP